MANVQVAFNKSFSQPSIPFHKIYLPDFYYTRKDSNQCPIIQTCFYNKLVYVFFSDQWGHAGPRADHLQKRVMIPFQTHAQVQKNSFEGESSITKGGGRRYNRVIDPIIARFSAYKVNFHAWQGVASALVILDHMNPLPWRGTQIFRDDVENGVTQQTAARCICYIRDLDSRTAFMWALHLP